ncbi:MAG TPA: phosphoribosyltransferase family protein [Candidatus Paceibacterota bacterium]
MRRLATIVLDLLFPPRPDERQVRAFTEDTLLARSSPRLIRVCRPEATALLSFADPQVRALMHEAKYHRSERAFSLLSSALQDYLTEWQAEEGFGRAVLTPIPLSNARRAERGYNQAEEIARRALRESDLSLATDILVRTRDTVSQTTLSRQERIRNMRGAFGAAHPLDPTLTYLLLDDVVTTGATMQAAIDALTAAGATRIIPLALAH